jgi:hypothetical protein
MKKLNGKFESMLDCIANNYISNNGNIDKKKLNNELKTILKDKK